MEKPYSRTGKNSAHVGKRFINNQGSEGLIVDVMTPTDPREEVRRGRKGTLVLIEFESGYSDWYHIRNVRVGRFKDYGVPTKYGGYSHPNIEDVRVYQTWMSMLKRCYNKDGIDYEQYGGRGVVVCDRWKHLSNFEEDIKGIEGYDNWISDPDNYSLDKDYIVKDNKVYCKEYCRFSNNIEQATNRSIVVPVRSIDENGNEMVFKSISEASKRLGLNPSRIGIVARGKEWQTTGGYRFEIVN